jgi:hypothetical protein
MTTNQSDLEASLSTLAQMRETTDSEIPISWLLLPLASYLVWAVFAIALWSEGTVAGAIDLTAVVNGAGILGIALGATASYVIYKLLNRANEHSVRARVLLSTALSSLENRSRPLNSPTLFSLNSANTGLYNLTQSEKERSAILWALLSLVPFAGWIFLLVSQWRVSRDLAKHTQLESLVLDDVDRALRSGGVPGLSLMSTPIRVHDLLALVVAILSILELSSALVIGLSGSLILVYLTIGAFSIFWIDLSIRDPTDHFNYHSQFEGELIRAIPDATSRSSGAA